MKEKIISWKKAMHAWHGLQIAFKYERNLKIELIWAIIVVSLLGALGGSVQDFMIVLAAIFLVLITELINTSIERLVDMIHPNKHPHAKIVKDMAAGFVLMAVFFSIFVGVFVFYPLVILKF